MKSLFKTHLRRCGFVVIRTHHSAMPYVDHPPHSLFEVIMLRELPSLEGLTFVQIGANDGKRFDPLNRWVTAHRWVGVLVEPMPAMFAQLNETYARQGGLKFIQAALAPERGQSTLFHIRQDLVEPVPDWVLGIAAFDRRHVLEHLKSIGWGEDKITCSTVPTITWNDVWSFLPTPRCDILMLDIEGCDVPLLATADLARQRPRIVHFEHIHAETGPLLSLYSDLLRLGYEIATEAGDTTAWLPAARQ